MPTTPTHFDSAEHPSAGPAGRRTPRGARARRAGAWGATVLVLGTGALALSACGSSSSAVSPASTTSSTAAKQAGGAGLDVHLTVENRTYQPVGVDLCGEDMVQTMKTDTCEKHMLEGMRRSSPMSGPWNTADQIRGTVVQGIIHFSGKGVTFEANNPPMFAAPGFRLALDTDMTPERLEDAYKNDALSDYAPFYHNPVDDDGVSTSQLRFVEGQVEKHTMDGHVLQLERAADGNWKEMKITILPY